MIVNAKIFCHKKF